VVEMTADSRGERGFLPPRGTPKIRKGHVLADMPQKFCRADPLLLVENGWLAGGANIRLPTSDPRPSTLAWAVATRDSRLATYMAPGCRSFVTLLLTVPEKFPRAG
jgi:hypothetical protein